MEIRPSALCCRIRVPLFIRIRTIRKSGYFARVLELRPLSRCQESSSRSCRSSRSKSICSKGSANPGKRFNASMPSPGWQALRFVAIMSLPPVRLRCDYVHANCDTVGNECLKRTKTQKIMINDMLLQNWSTLHRRDKDSAKHRIAQPHECPL